MATICGSGLSCRTHVFGALQRLHSFEPMPRTDPGKSAAMVAQCSICLTTTAGRNATSHFTVTLSSTDVALSRIFRTPRLQVVWGHSAQLAINTIQEHLQRVNTSRSTGIYNGVLLTNTAQTSRGFKIVPGPQSIFGKLVWGSWTRSINFPLPGIIVVLKLAKNWLYSIPSTNNPFSQRFAVLRTHLLIEAHI